MLVVAVNGSIRSLPGAIGARISSSNARKSLPCDDSPFRAKFRVLEESLSPVSRRSNLLPFCIGRETPRSIIHPAQGSSSPRPNHPVLSECVPTQIQQGFRVVYNSIESSFLCADSSFSCRAAIAGIVVRLSIPFDGRCGVRDNQTSSKPASEPAKNVHLAPISFRSCAGQNIP